MNDSPQVRAEVLKLARLLGRNADELAYLHRLRVDDIRRLRERATDILFEAERRRMQRLALASRLLTPALIAMVAQKAFGPLLAARVAGYLDASRAAEVARRLPVAFRADMAVEMDPRRVVGLVSQLPAESIVGVARELRRRDEFVTMGRFAGHLADDALRAVLADLDDEALLRVAFVTEDRDRLDRIIGLLPAARLAGLMRTAMDARLWSELLDLLGCLGEPLRAELLNAAADQGDAVLDSMVDAVRDHNLWGVLLPAARAMREESRARLAEHLAVMLPQLTATQREGLALEVQSAGIVVQWAARDAGQRGLDR